MQDRITIRMSPELIERLDEWIAAQPGYVSRQEAMRRLATFALDQGCLIDPNADNECDGEYARPVPGSDPLHRTS
jgi:hypothetical protein